MMDHHNPLLFSLLGVFFLLGEDPVLSEILLKKPHIISSRSQSHNTMVVVIELIGSCLGNTKAFRHYTKKYIFKIKL